MKTPFDMIDHTADVGVVAYGADARELRSESSDIPYAETG
jgi:SHS2 domain-containing protein